MTPQQECCTFLSPAGTLVIFVLSWSRPHCAVLGMERPGVCVERIPPGVTSVVSKLCLPQLVGTLECHFGCGYDAKTLRQCR